MWPNLLHCVALVFFHNSTDVDIRMTAAVQRQRQRHQLQCHIIIDESRITMKEKQPGLLNFLIRFEFYPFVYFTRVARETKEIEGEETEPFCSSFFLQIIKPLHCCFIGFGLFVCCPLINTNLSVIYLLYG